MIDRSQIDGVIFDLDGVVTDTASLHQEAWRETFDAVLLPRDEAPFSDEDYRVSVDGKTREDGVEAFLASRGISLPLGRPTGRTLDTVRGIAARKDQRYKTLLIERGPAPYDSTVVLIKELREHGFKTAIISASRNCCLVLERAGLSDLFDARVDGLDAVDLQLKGKPDPAVFLEAADRIGCAPARCAIVEDAIAGVQAGKAGGFALVIGVDRTGHPDELRTHGADLVVSDLREVRLR